MRSLYVALGGFLVASMLASSPAEASGTPAAPAPAWARSVEVVSAGAPIVAAPMPNAPRRGTVSMGARLPLEARVFGEGCAAGVYVRIGAGRYVCETYVRASPEPPGGARLPRLADGALLPRRYAFVREDGAPVYEHPADYFAGAYLETLGVGYGLVVTGRTEHEGVRFARLRSGRYVTESAIRYVRGSDFAGVELAAGERPDAMAWVIARRASLYASPGGRAERRLERLERLSIVGPSADDRYLEVEGGGYVRRADVRRPTAAEPPAGVGPTERWIDVDLGQQALVAYEGRTPRFVTLISAGRGGRDSETPKGAFRIWVKLAFSDMNNFEQPEARESYGIESVPWVQFFEGAIGLHAAFWHNQFGEARSHGCVNLAPRDARYIFDFTAPVLPDGWEAVLPDAAQSTLVRVR